MKNKRLFQIGTLASSLLLLTGCVGRDASGNPSGPVWDLLGHPMSMAIDWFAQLMGGGIGSFAFGIIMVTIIVRLIIAPLAVSMTKASYQSSERMQFIKPHTDQLNERLKAAASAEEQMAIRQEMMELQKQAGVQMISAQGCLPVFIQLPIISALYFAVISSPNVLSDTFFGIALNTPSLLLGGISAVLYYIQGLISQIGMSPEQKKVNQTAIFMAPVLQIVFSMSVPAGAALYWVVGGLASCLTTAYTALVLRPRIKADIAEELKDKQFTTSQRKDVTPATPTKKVAINNQRRNAGKQNRK